MRLGISDAFIREPGIQLLVDSLNRSRDVKKRSADDLILQPSLLHPDACAHATGSTR
jgi:hypothetical protein